MASKSCNEPAVWAPAEGYPSNAFPSKKRVDGIPQDRPVRVYADGIYDMFHFGHARALRQAKNVFPNCHLIVGVCNDEMTHRLKGKTVMSEDERYESIIHCRYVDEVVRGAPWIITQEFMDKYKIDVIVHGEDACLDADGNDIYQFAKDAGHFRTIQRTDGVSTSDLIFRIVKNYDEYVSRNLHRGYTAKDMNVSLIKEGQIRAKEKIEKLRQTVEKKGTEIRASSKKIVKRVKDQFDRQRAKLVTKFPFLFHRTHPNAPSNLDEVSQSDPDVESYGSSESESESE